MRTKKMRRRLTVGAALLSFGAAALGVGAMTKNGEVGWGQGEVTVVTTTDTLTPNGLEESFEVGWV